MAAGRLFGGYHGRGPVTASYGDRNDFHKAKLKEIDSEVFTLSLRATHPGRRPEGKSTKFVGEHDALKTDAK